MSDDDKGCTDRRSANVLRDAELQQRVLRFIREEDARHKTGDPKIDTIENGVLELSHGNWNAKLAGVETKTVLLAFILLACVGFFWYVTSEGRRIDADYRTDYLAQHKITQSLLERVIVITTEAQKLSYEQINEVVYVLTRDQKQRDALKMEMPTSLRRKLNER